MNNETDTLTKQYSELCRSFIMALQNNSSSDELEVIRKQIREIVAKMKTQGLPEPPEE